MYDIDEMDQVARKALEALGSTVDDVAGRLEKEGCKGIRNRAASCPVAMYFNSKLPGYWAEYSCHDVHIAMLGGTTTFATIRTNKAVALFARRFDYGHYPTLEE